ncbi:hypothetical protein T02_929 [Trichinella nativa]|uniref:Uncharacterized protein n=1 Tax=Trichinella nativa TaxID=6335 RepID=A0A0V1LD96_9BILA|nr:hypothetical protein T02_929 [Trichinella nativa]
MLKWLTHFLNHYCLEPASPPAVSRYGIRQKTPTAHSGAKASSGRLMENENIHLHLNGENTG